MKKELTKENESIGNICNNNSLDLVMVSHTILNTILRTQSNKKEKKFLKSKLFNNLIKKQNTKKRNKKKQSNSCNIKLSNDQKRIEKLKKELNLKIIKPINKNEKLTEKEILYEKLNFPKLGPFIRKNHFIDLINDF